MNVLENGKYKDLQSKNINVQPCSFLPQMHILIYDSFSLFAVPVHPMHAPFFRLILLSCFVSLCFPFIGSWTWPPALSSCSFLEVLYRFFLLFCSMFSSGLRGMRTWRFKACPRTQLSGFNPSSAISAWCDPSHIKYFWAMVSLTAKQR